MEKEQIAHDLTMAFLQGEIREGSITLDGDEDCIKGYVAEYKNIKKSITEKL